MSKYKITIITPTYNRAHTLKRAFNSLVNQTFKDFLWVIADDGSTDQTEELVKEFQKENLVTIQYYKQENSKKFYTVFKAIQSVKTDYFAILDSDDAYPDKALEILIKEANSLNPDEFISLIGHSIDEEGKLFGDLFPGNGFDGSVFEMRYKYKIKGDKNGLFLTKPYLKYLSKFDFEVYKGKYAPQKIFFQIYDGEGMKTRFFNEIVRIYYYDSTDLNSMSADRVKPTSYEGLRDGCLSFVNSYKGIKWTHPIAYFRNMVGYLTYSQLLKDSWKKSIQKLNSLPNKILGILLIPFSFGYTLLKKP